MEIDWIRLPTCSLLMGCEEEDEMIIIDENLHNHHDDGNLSLSYLDFNIILVIIRLTLISQGHSTRTNYRFSHSLALGWFSILAKIALFKQCSQAQADIQ